MDTQNPSAPPHAQSRLAANNNPNQRHPHSGGGLVHENTRHTTRFTVIGNHLAQHPELSALAIGLAVYIQSLPAGARVDIKTLTARFPEGTTRITDLPPGPLCRPAALLAHRLTTQLPPPPPFRAPAPPPPDRHPFQTCERCDRAFRAPLPGRCRDCRIPDPVPAA
ncbi:hypothetical protein [Streptomyces sp. SD31]|uniref:hypothetical protein n=1 Tax=Streptomyces sp. SD31 TaxID=3452208 RepID=UPI003F886263